MKKIFNSIVSLLAVLTVITFFSCTSPSSNDSTVSATAVVNSMKFGWNLGNTLDACNSGDYWISKTSEEIDWGLKGTATSELFQKLKDSGIKSVRIPVSWHNHVDSSFNIYSEWMNHVKEVVDMAYSKGLYVIINIHHDNYDGSSLETSAGFTLKDSDKTQSLKFVESNWKQVAAEFKYYDERLIFETLNEPRLIGDSHEWGWNSSCDTCKTAISIINELNQKAVDTIRSSGGNNANRVIMFPSYVASPYAAINAKNAGLFKIPSDSATGKLVLSVHMYTPYNFAMNCTESEGAHSNFTESDKTELSQHFTDLNATFISKGIPVVIGEMGATNKNNFDDRKAWFKYYLELCKQYNVAALLWDNGQETNSNPSEAFGYMNRTEKEWFTASRASELISTAVNARN
ncbi:MAG: glycoside hydrolase family 5 protein [Treponema sp.]